MYAERNASATFSLLFLSIIIDTSQNCIYRKSVIYNRLCSMVVFRLLTVSSASARTSQRLAGPYYKKK